MGLSPMLVIFIITNLHHWFSKPCFSSKRYHYDGIPSSLSKSPIEKNEKYSSYGSGCSLDLPLQANKLWVPDQGQKTEGSGLHLNLIHRPVFSETNLADETKRCIWCDILLVYHWRFFPIWCHAWVQIHKSRLDTALIDFGGTAL